MFDEYDGYKQIEGYCKSEGMVGEYQTHEEAIDHCTDNEECQGIYDLSCDFLGPFSNCKGKENVIENKSNSCLHIKHSSKT